MSSFGLIEQNVELSHIYQAVNETKKFEVISTQIFLLKVAYSQNVLHFRSNLQKCTKSRY